MTVPCCFIVLYGPICKDVEDWNGVPVYCRVYLSKADCISHSTNTLGKGMNSAILSPSYG